MERGIAFLNSLRGMITFIAVIVGIYLGLIASPLPAKILHYAGKLHKVIIILIITIILSRIIKGMVKVYTGREKGIKHSLSLFNTIINIVIYSIGILIILNALGISITPIITALGVGGLAVALALQDTLSNLFAGIYIITAGIIRPGDYIILSSGEEGTVNDITWRCTTLLTLSKSIVVIPNSKLSTTIVTNHSLPERSLNISIPIGVAYGCDLDKVEQVALNAVDEVLKELNIEQLGATFRVKEFGDSSINCKLSIIVYEYGQQYVMQHHILKRIYQRFNQESIDIPFPTRTVFLKKEN